MARSNSGTRRHAKKVNHVVATSSVGTCRACGKKQYLTAGAAKKAAKRLFPGRTGAERHHAYGCGDYYHFGRHGQAVRAGLATRDEVYHDTQAADGEMLVG